MPIERAAGRQLSTRAAKVSALRLRGARSWLSARDRMFFTERLALLLETGIPLHSALDSLAAQASDTVLREVLQALRSDIAGGRSFAQSLERQPKSFAPTFVNLVGAAETGGFLPDVLQKLREMDERREELNSTLTTALSYPAFLALFSTAVVIFVLVVVFPKFAVLFASIHDELPITTRVLMATSDVLVLHWYWLLAGLGALLGGLWRWSLLPESAARIDRFLLRIPVLREVIVELQLVQFLHMIGLSLSHGVSLMDSLRACREIARSASFRAFVASLESHVQGGGRIAAGFESSKLVPPLVQQMIATGEESGNLAFVSARVAGFYEREWRRKLTILSKIAEPAMLLVMGSVVGLIVASLILPIFKLSTAVH